MVTWMKHLQHGLHPAIGAEVEQLRAAGWTECALKSTLRVAEPTPAVEPPRKKPGRPVKGK